MWSYNYTDPDILEHYGILGMKWGVRRFQDKKGRLTSAGKKRYSEESSNGSSKKSSKTSKEVGDSLIRTGIHTMQSGDSYLVSLIILEWIISKLTTIPFTMPLALLVFRESIQTLWRPIPSQLIIIEKRFWNLDEIIRKILAMIYHCRMFEKQCIGITVLKFRRISCLI